LTFQVTILGSGSATPTLNRNPSAQILCYENECYLIDCGEGTQVQMLRYKLRPGRLRGIFISHLHGDHYFGLIGLLTTLSLGQRTDELKIFGPPGLREIISLQLSYSDTRLTYPVDFHEIATPDAQTIYETSHLTVRTVPLRHRIHCTGFVFSEKPRKRSLLRDKLPDELTPEQIRLLKEGHDLVLEGQTYPNAAFTTAPPLPRQYAYCSDTIYDEALAEHVRDVTLLYHEATFGQELAERASKTYHSTAHQAAQIARLAGAKALLIGHYSSRYRDVTPLLREAQAVFPNTRLATEGETYTL
jgi:ribonuclease Z